MTERMRSWAGEMRGVLEETLAEPYIRIAKMLL
jgi:hypothetical protein